MAETVAGKKMSAYTNIDDDPELTEEQKEYYKNNAVVTSFGQISCSDNTLYNYNVHIPHAPNFPELPSDSDDKTYILSVKNGVFSWIDDTGSGSGSGSGSNATA